jgi:hypothetical protein
MNIDEMKWKKKKYHTVGTVPKSNLKIVEKGKSTPPPKHTYTIAYLSGLVQVP